MAKFLIARAGAKKWEFELENRLYTLGRDRSSDIVIMDPAVSRSHARILCRGDVYVLEDLQSTNGTVVNGQKIIKQHVLRDGDRIHLGAHVLRFEADDEQGQADEVDKTVVIMPLRTHRQPESSPGAPSYIPPKETPPVAAVVATPVAEQATVHFMSGPDLGTSQPITKSLFTIGKPGANLAVISRRPQGYFLLHLGGRSPSQVNGQNVHGGGVKLNDGDNIKVGDLVVRFHLKTTG